MIIMKKTIVIFIISVLLACLVYSEEEQNPKIHALGNIVYLDGGDVITNLGIANGIILNGGYEGYVIDYLSAFAEINTWVMNDILIAYGFGINVHPFSRFRVDPYAGFGIMYGIDINTKKSLIDIPVDLGVNLMVNDFFGFKIQAKLYLLSLAYAFTEINAGVLVKF
jgi:hypothetical protein